MEQEKMIRRVLLGIAILAAAVLFIRCAGAQSGSKEESGATGTGEQASGTADRESDADTAGSLSSEDSGEAGSLSSAESAETGSGAQIIEADAAPDEEAAALFTGYAPERTSSTSLIAQTQDMQSNYAVLINGASGIITAGLNESARIVPASMTKILTLLTAVKSLEQKGQNADGTYAALDEPFTITIEITDFAFRNGGSTVGFAVGETVPVRDLLYGTILPSGADAAAALAVYTAGSQEAFVDLMNQEVEKLGLSSTSHFTNCVGFYDENLYTTPTDMAMILKAAVEDPLCREVLSAHQYTTAPTEQHPDGITVSNWFLRRIEDKDTHGTVRCAKTGYVKESRNCAASYEISNDGTPWFCVTADAHSAWRAIYDHVTIYQTYVN